MKLMMARESQNVRKVLHFWKLQQTNLFKIVFSWINNNSTSKQTNTISNFVLDFCNYTVFGQLVMYVCVII